MLQSSGMSTLLQAALLNSDPKTLLSSCSITIKVCLNTKAITIRIDLSPLLIYIHQISRQVAQQSDAISRRNIMTEGALSLFNLIFGSYTQETNLLEAAANMML
jgi:hypothetical protein